ncbi:MULTISPECIES: hypothetical protein [unclassified Frankia]|nr:MULTISPECIES: hypothetical protein [unclassified Frankia]
MLMAAAGSRFAVAVLDTVRGVPVVRRGDLRPKTFSTQTGT